MIKNKSKVRHIAKFNDHVALCNSKIHLMSVSGFEYYIVYHVSCGQMRMIRNFGEPFTQFKDTTICKNCLRKLKKLHPDVMIPK